MTGQGQNVWSPEQMDRVRRGVMSLQEGERFTAAVGDLYNAARAVWDEVERNEHIYPEHPAMLTLGAILDGEI